MLLLNTVFQLLALFLLKHTFGILTLAENKANLLALEQSYLDWLFRLPAELRYNFLPVAGSSLGYTHSEETLAKISGENNPMFGRSHSDETKSKISTAKSGKNHTEETKRKISLS
jgi:group I intron endonuclease